MLNTTNIKIEKLQETLKQNLSDHVEIYNTAMLAYETNYKDYVSEFAKEVAKGDLKREFRPPIRPVSYAKNYEDVISQLEYEAEDVITLSSQEFKNYILDEWNFTNVFYSNTQTMFGSHKVPSRNWSPYTEMSESAKNKLANYSND